MFNPNMFSNLNSTPKKFGLYNSNLEKEACGLAAIVNFKKPPSHSIVSQSLKALCTLEHRGSIGADSVSGDGAGILTQIPDDFFRKVVDFSLPSIYEYAVGMVFLPVNNLHNFEKKLEIKKFANKENIKILGWRKIPINLECLGKIAKKSKPSLEQVFVQYNSNKDDVIKGLHLDRIIFKLRKILERKCDIYFASFSSRTCVYKGMLTTTQLRQFYLDLNSEHFKSKLSIVHSRYSTNTFPSWNLAQPLRLIAHNGEINTISGNRNWMRAREFQLKSQFIGNFTNTFPICTKNASDSTNLDEVIELLTLNGRTLPHSLMMMIPEAWEEKQIISKNLKSFYAYHSLLMEPWDGPAMLLSTDGSLVTASLDRNGLRPCRFFITNDSTIVIGSEYGILDMDPKKIIKQGRLGPGEILVVDTKKNKLIYNDQVKNNIIKKNNWEKILKKHLVHINNLPVKKNKKNNNINISKNDLFLKQKVFNYSREDVEMIISHMAKNGSEPIFSMGSDTPIAILANKPKLLFDYFVQRFAQITNPPLDSIREKIVTSLKVNLGPKKNILHLVTSKEKIELKKKDYIIKNISLNNPVLNNSEMKQIKCLKLKNIIEINKSINFNKKHFIYSKKITLVIKGVCYKNNVNNDKHEFKRKIKEICNTIDKFINFNNITYVVLSDNFVTEKMIPIPSLLLVSSVHQHLIKSNNRLKVSLIVETGEARTIHHVSMLIGYGAEAVNPYLGIITSEYLAKSNIIKNITATEASKNFIEALNIGILKTMSKLGISTVSSYLGAQAFEAIGLNKEFLDLYFKNTISNIKGGININDLQKDSSKNHTNAYVWLSSNENIRFYSKSLTLDGEYKWKRGGSPHLFNPNTISLLQHSTKMNSYKLFKKYTKLVNIQKKNPITLRSLFKIKYSNNRIPINKVEPISKIIKRFSTGAMSFGSISKEAHENLAIAMNKLGGKSNTGEGGEDYNRLYNLNLRSAIKQIASGRFGVTSLYLSNADDIQIKISQGAKPGEGGQLPPEKVYPWIAKTRLSTPGIGLISPPPHHDIYSIEDLKQLIFDLKSANPNARIHTKLVSQTGIGPIAVGVVKGLIDVILVSGYDGGTGASPISSLKHAGTPWELGLTEVHQTLILNGLRHKVTLQVDGQLKTGRDVIVGALLGAEEFCFATAPLVTQGCILMKACHLNTCPVGIATQNPELRKRFNGKVDFLLNFFKFIAKEVREYLSKIGVSSLSEIIGQSNLLEKYTNIKNKKITSLDFDDIFQFNNSIKLKSKNRKFLNKTKMNNKIIKNHFDRRIIKLCNLDFKKYKNKNYFHNIQPVSIKLDISNTDRSVGTMLGYFLTKINRNNIHKLSKNLISINLIGTAGQSFGAFIPRGINLKLYGNANDYVGKGLSGGRIIIKNILRNSSNSNSIIAGNVIGYGATSGEIYIAGCVGERFMVRNSGANSVVEGIGEHGLEYMTGGKTLILGPVGRNLGAGMSGGIAYILNLDMININKEAIQSGDLLLLNPNDVDLKIIYIMLKRHISHTNSSLAKKILKNIHSEKESYQLKKKFTKIIPKYYHHILKIQKFKKERVANLYNKKNWKKILDIIKR